MAYQSFNLLTIFFILFFYKWSILILIKKERQTKQTKAAKTLTRVTLRDYECPSRVDHPPGQPSNLIGRVVRPDNPDKRSRVLLKLQGLPRPAQTKKID